jgi:glycine betaine/proline transport system ATP-binding protein
MTPTILELKNLSLLFGGAVAQAKSLLDQRDQERQRAGLCRAEISKITGTFVALNKINLDIRLGEILVLMGPSGSGKSSLLRCLNGLNGSAGKGTLFGEIYLTTQNSKVALHQAPLQLWQSIRTGMMAMVFQQSNLLAWRTVAQNLELPLEILGVPREERRSRAVKMLQLVNLQAWGDKRPHELSGGMQQRVGIARALITEAPILLMDEPFSALDPQLRSQLQEELLDLNEHFHKTIVFVSHDRDEAIRLGQRIGILKEGELLQVGDPQELLAAPADPEVTAMLRYQDPWIQRKECRKTVATTRNLQI